VTVTNRTAEQPPRTIVVAWAALIAAAACAVLSVVSLFGAKPWLRAQRLKSINDQAITGKYTAADKQHDLATVSSYVSKLINYQLVTAVILAILLVFIAVRMRSGAHWTRWVLVGVWVLLTVLQISLIGFLPAVAVTVGKPSAPILVKIVCDIGAIAFLVAVVAVNLRPSTEYLNAHKPVRATTGGTPAPGFRGLFGPRNTGSRTSADAGSRPPPIQPGKTKAKPPPSQPSVPAAKSEPAPRAKAKVRTVSAKPSAKTRGKSRGR
jgi:hypothetical protein